MALSGAYQDVNLFEFSNREFVEGNKEKLRAFLDELWNSRERSGLSYPEEATGDDQDIAKQQRFLAFLKDGELKNRNYVGLIRFNDRTYNLLPKVFYEEGWHYNAQDVKAIQAHVLWWLSYCRRFKFPKSFSGYNHIKSNFFEVMIYLFASYTRKILQNFIYQTYQQKADDLSFVKGRIDVNQYAKNIGRGAWNRISCEHDSFEIDNQFNRIVKYVARLLLNGSVDLENKRLLEEILFILDDVEDVVVTADDCFRVNLNPLFSDLFTVLDYCKLFLSGSTVLTYKNELKVFAFLLPMEYVFEDFLFGFIQEKFKTQFDQISVQRSDKYLAHLKVDGEDKGNAFQLQHDIYLEKGDHKTIVDAKYKKIALDRYDQDRKLGISQSDMYQMVSYALRRGTDQVHLFYPGFMTDQGKREPQIRFTVEDGLHEDRKIHIHAHRVPIIAAEGLGLDTSGRLENVFKGAEARLATVMQNALNIDNGLGPIQEL